MTSSGMRRKLAAVAAVSAVALAGLATAPASAITIDDLLDPSDVTVLYNPGFPNQLNSTKVDGNGETTLKLVAGASKAFGGTTTNAIRFFTPANLAWLDVTVPVQQGVATYEWTPPDNVGNIAVSAQAVGSGGIPLGAADSGSINTNPNHNSREATSIDGAFRSRKGYFINSTAPAGQFAAVTGDSGSPAVIVGGQVPTTGAFAPFIVPAFTSPPDVNGLRNWAGVINVAGLVTPLIDGDDDLVVFTQGNDDENSQVYTSYQQQIAVNSPTLTVAPGSTGNVFGDSDGPGGQPAANNWSLYDIKLTDQEGRPVAGADVWEANAAGVQTNCFADFVNPTNPAAVLNPVRLRTDGTGMLRVRLQELAIDALFPTCDSDPAAGVQESTFVVDANGDGDYDPGTDTLLKARQTNLAATPANVTVTDNLGANQDDDEVSTLKIKVTDADGDPVVGTNVAVKVAEDNRSNPAENVGLTDPGLVFSPTDANGEITVTGITSSVLGIGPTSSNDDWSFVTWQVTAGAATGSLTIQYDRARLDWDTTTVQGLKGTTINASGALTLTNSGDPLGNRLVGHTYFPSVDANAGDPGVLAGNSRYSATQPAGTVSGTPTTATSTTAADGSFSVAIEDPAAPDGEELNSKSLVDAVGLTIDPFTATVETPINYGAPDGVAVGARPAVSDLLDVDFLRSLTPTLVTIHNGAGTSTADGLIPVLGGTLRPGGLGLGNVQAFNSDGVALANTDVDLTIDEGNFVDFFGDAFEATPVVDAPVDFKSAGSSVTVNTGASTFGLFTANIERNEGFDDDGNVSDKIHATAGAASDSHDLVWTTNGVPVNPAASNPLVVELSADQESSILPKARAGNTAIDAIPGDGSGQVVDHDVRTLDQFGNRTSQQLNVTDNTPLAGFVVPTGTSEFDLTNPAISSFAGSATNQSLEVELVGATMATYKDNAATSAFDPTNPAAVINAAVPVDIEDNTDAVNWYDVDFGASTITLGQEGPETVEVGTAVTEVVAATDQEGQPIENMIVDFLRGGPSSDDDDTCNEDLLNTCQATDGNGEAFYDFVGGSEGTANVSAVLYSAEGVRILTVGPDTVVFTRNTHQVHVNALLGGQSSQGKDILRVTAPGIAAGATVRLQKKVGNKWVTLGKAKKLDGAGDRQFGVKDKNGDRVTKYRARVSATDFIFGDVTPVKRLK